MSSAKRNETRCLVDGKPLPRVEIGRPRLYCSVECKRRADGAVREIARLRNLIPSWQAVGDTGRVATMRAEIRALERILAARHELIPRSEAIGATVRGLRALAGRMRAAGCDHVDELESLLGAPSSRRGAFPAETSRRPEP
jgi:hypothetical protein